jgi:hypothetical protein
VQLARVRGELADLAREAHALAAEQLVLGMVIGWLLTNTAMGDTHARALQIFSRRRQRRRDARAADRV